MHLIFFDSFIFIEQFNFTFSKKCVQTNQPEKVINVSEGDSEPDEPPNKISRLTTLSSGSSQSVMTQKKIQVMAVDKVSIQHKSQLDDIYGSFVFSLDEPNSVAGSTYFHKFLKALRPGYKLPSLEELYGDILDRSIINTKATIAEKSTQLATLMIYVDSETEVVTIYAHPRHGQAVMIQSWSMESNEEDFVDLIEKCLENCISDFKLKIDSCVSTNEEIKESLIMISGRESYVCPASIAMRFKDAFEDESLTEEVKSIITAFLENTHLKGNFRYNSK